MEKESISLNENDGKLLAFCMNQRRTVNEISKFLSIAPASVSVKIQRLEKAGFINVERKGQGKKTFVRTKKGDKTNKYYIKILSEIKKRGKVTEEEYSRLLPFDPYDPLENDRFRATLSLPFVYPKLITRTITLTKEGEKFLKEKKK